MLARRSTLRWVAVVALCAGVASQAEAQLLDAGATDGHRSAAAPARLLDRARAEAARALENWPKPGQAEVGAVNRSPSNEPQGRGVLFWTAIGAGIGGGLGRLSNVGVDCDLPENLCPVRTVGGAVMGAIGGLLIGLGR